MIKVENLSKEFKISKKYPGFKGALRSFFSTEYTIKKAVDDISFEINDGEIVGYIGANGAGKSTTIKMMTGILTPSSGRIIVDGVIPYENREKNAKNIGVVFGQKTQLWWDLPVSETFPLLKDIYGVSDEDYEERMNYFKEILGLDEFFLSPVRTLSLGQRMRADLAAALIHNPKIIYLDEPTIGLDVGTGYDNKIGKAFTKWNYYKSYYASKGPINESMTWSYDGKQINNSLKIKIDYPANSGVEEGFLTIKNLKLTVSYRPTQETLK